MVACAATMGAACGEDDGAAEPPASPCKAFAKASGPALRVEPVSAAAPEGARHVTFDGVRAYVVDGAGALASIEAGTVATAHGGPFADAIVSGGALYATRVRAGGFDVVRVRSTDGGKTFDPASETVLAAPAAADLGEAALPIVRGEGGLVYVAGPDRVLAVEANGDGTAAPAVVASGFVAARSLAFDDITRDVWLVDREADADVLHRIRSDVSRDAAPPLKLDRRLEGVGIVVRDRRSSALEGRFVIGTASALVVVDPFGPSGPPSAKAHPVAAGPVIGVDESGAAVVRASGLSRIVDDAAPAAPSSLAQTGCLDPTGAVAYEVAAPLWSDGAEKARAVVLPPGGRARVMPDGDLRFPVGTVAIKTFGRGGRRIETRLFVQHAQDDWVGYTYAWNEAQTDAELVVGNAVKGDWYFPSSSDCNACHTPAAGFTLGIEARQLDEAAKERLAVGSGVPRLDPKDARAYLHANCSVCHREGSVTGSAELDLRFDTPLERTGLCAEPKVGTLGITGARIVAPGAPERSVLAARMRAQDETRMPKLATRVVDEAGVALVESWIRALPGCP